MVSALDRKALRDLLRLWAQVLAIGGVLACGVMVLVLGSGTRASLEASRAAYYERQRFAEIFADATRVPETLLPEIAAIPGVARLSPSIRTSAVIDLPGVSEPVSADVRSLPVSGRDPVLNAPLLRAGRMPDPLHPDEVALYAPFAEARGLMPGDRLSAVIEGQRRSLTVTGHVLSPEYIYTIGPGSMMPDDARFGVLWIGQDAAAAATDMNGAFNSLALQLARDAVAPAVISALDRLLAPYGGTGAHDRSDQISHAFLQSELEQLGAMALILPPIFLTVSAFLVNMVLSRLIALERAQIGLLKAVGYTTGAIATHYLKLAAGIALIGTVVGWGAGWYLGAAMTRMYADFFRLPWLIYAPSAWPFVLSALLALLTTLSGAGRAVWASVRLPPAVAMSPPAPPVYRRGLIDGLGAWAHLQQTTMMILRAITRWPGRAAVTVFGVAASVSVLIASFFTYDAIDLMVDEIFTRANRQNVTLILASARNESALDDARALPGVIRAEGAFVLPVRLRNANREELSSLTAHPEHSELSRLIDDKGRQVQLPDHGLVLPEGLAGKLGVAPGDMVTVEALAPPRETWAVPLTATIRQTLGQDAHIAAPALFRLMRQTPQVNQINLQVDATQMDALNAAVKSTPAIAGIADWTRTRSQFTATIEENLSISTVIYSALGMLITLGVVYNAARIRLSERVHELASLRVLGFSRGEVAWVLVGELMLLTLIGLPVGWAGGYGFAALVVQGFSTDVVALPLVVNRQTFAYASLIVLATALAAALVVRRRLDRIDIVQALKARD
ncbi:ABC transporter permease [Sedimentimonas flavescens]|uniref:ABC transporter permease n=1 Tax=Sedimentimonas flavescens TaxID=2851012 RepID=UPI0021A581F7|nr:ABC transporter permease [Sedimentimonas flavescens]MCT2540112.1 ABC transporter permease [Sedimentimonas flavescens]